MCLVRIRGRQVLRRLLTVLGVLLIAAGLVAGVAHREVLDGRRFAEHVDAIRSDPAVARELGQLISDRVLDTEPDLVAIRPLLESASAAVVSSPALGPLIRSTLEPLHGALVSGSGGNVVLRLADVGALVVAAINTLAPGTSAAIPENLDVRLADIGAGTATADVIQAAHLVDRLAWLLPLLGGLCWAAAALVAGRGLRGALDVVRRGLFGVAGVLTLLVLVTDLIVARMGSDTLRGALVEATWKQLDTSLWRSALVVVLAALALAVVGSAGLRFDPRTARQDLAAWLSTRPTGGRARAARAVVVLAIGVVAVLEPLACVRVAVALAGVALVVLALRELGRVALAALRRRAPGFLRGVTERMRHGVAVAVALVVLLGLVVVGSWPTSTAMSTAPQESGEACNGHVELCQRRYNEVAYPATHNSMSAADEPGWFLAEQPTGVIGQLDAGIRVFLIDSWPGQATDQNSIIANSDASRATAMAQATAELGADVVESALRLRSALHLTPTGPVKPYLCHALCELGSTPWLPLMQQVKAWMVAHPREVVTFFIQDEVSPADTAKVFADAGLDDYLYTPTWGEQWPTLEQMIDTDRRIVVLQEHRVDAAYPWMLDGKVWSQDTPFDFRSASAFSCELFRGQADSPLFLVNHWLNRPGRRIAAASQVNTRDVLLTRMEKCQAERGRIPNYVAVDYYSEGDLFGVVDALNGL
jgi:hypothetical protein